MSTGQHLESNLKKLAALVDIDKQWAKALQQCQEHVFWRLKRRTIFGAHTQERLGMDPVDYYVGFAYEAILDGAWEWKEGRTLGQQMIRIANNRIGKEVDLYHTELNNGYTFDTQEIENFFYSEDLPAEETTIVQEAIFSHQISIVETAVKGDENLEMFWECIKDGMKREAIASFMEMNTRQIDKLREKLSNRVKNSPNF